MDSSLFRGFYQRAVEVTSETYYMLYTYTGVRRKKEKLTHQSITYIHTLCKDKVCGIVW